MAIDRIYGRSGREIAIFQRRGMFAGWRPVSGVVNSSGSLDGPRSIPEGLAYLQTYAERPIEADFEIEWIGIAPGQKLNVFVNQERTAELIFDLAHRKSSWLKQKISLSAGANDIVLQSNSPLTVHY